MIIIVAITVPFSILTAVWLSGSEPATGIEVYGGDINSAADVVTVDLGVISVGSSNTVSFFLRSTSKVPITVAYSLENWQPLGIQPFILVSWNYTGTQIAPGEQIPIRFDLNTSSSTDLVYYLITNEVASFSVNLSIYVVK